MLRLLFLLTFSYTLSSFSQIDAQNLTKYWAYRDRLHKNFLRVGNDNGESIPIAARRVGYPYQHWSTTNPQLANESSLYWSDATIYLGHYIMVLASEFHLLSASNENTESTLNEIYFALESLNRLDLVAENYLSGFNHQLSSDDINGFLLRDDVPDEFYFNFQNDFSLIFDQECNFDRVQSDFYHTNPFDINAGPIEIFEKNYQSLDQLTSIFSGLLFAQKFVGHREVSMPELSIYVEDINDVVKNITRRILNRLKDNEWRIANWDGSVGLNQPNSGLNLTIAAPMFEDIAAQIIGPAEAYWDNEVGPSSIDVIELKIPKCSICDWIDDKVYELDGWTALLALYPQLDLWYAAECTNLFGGCDGEIVDPTLPLEILDDLNLLNSELTMSEIRNAIETAEVNNIPLNTTEQGASKICFEFQKELHLPFDLFGSSIDIEVPITLCLRKGTLFGALDQLLFNNLEDGLNDDNVHIMHELAACSGLWGFEYVTEQAHLSGMDHYSLMHAVLHNNGQPYSSMDQNWYRDYFLNTAPCEGPFAHPYELTTSSGPIWASQNRLFHPGNAVTGPMFQFGTKPDFRGEFSGLDYMLYHNLYRMLWVEPNAYIRNVSCACIEEVLYENVVTTSKNIQPKFADYKDMGIPIESYLAHDLGVSSASGILNIKNDFVICSPDENTHTELTIEDGAAMNLYASNTITVRKGNTLRIAGGSTFRVGFADIAADYAYTEIILEENAKLIVEEGSSLLSYGTCKLTMETNSEFIVDGSVCMPANDDCFGLTFQTHLAQIHFINSEFISDDPGTGHMISLFVETVFVASNSNISFLSETPDLHSANAGGSWFEFQGNSVFTLAIPFEHSAGNVLFWDDAHLIVKNGNLKISDNCKLYWRSQDCRLLGNESVLSFSDGRMEIPSDYIFTFSHDNVESGHIEIDEESACTLLTGENSLFTLTGDDQSDVILKFNTGSKLQNINPELGEIQLFTGTVSTSNGMIQTDLDFYANDIYFTSGDVGIGKLRMWTNHLAFDFCRFDSQSISTHWSQFYLQRCEFQNSHCHIDGGHFHFNQCQFSNSETECEGLQHISGANDCFFEGGNPIFNDESQVELKFSRCIFNSPGNTGIFKTGGIATFRCCTFIGLSPAINPVDGAILNMSMTTGAGFNSFQQCNPVAYFQDAFNCWISKGHNDFSDLSSQIFTGNIVFTKCIHTSNGCINPVLDGSYNMWPGGGAPPAWPIIDLQGQPAASGCWSANNNQSICDLTVSDPSPIQFTECETVKPIDEVKKVLQTTSNSDNALLTTFVAGVDFTNSHAQLRDFHPDNPIITTSFFDHVELEEALLFSVNESELIDSLGNDSLAIEHLYQILTSDLDGNNEELRWKMLWGFNQMKSILENRFVQGEITAAANQFVFHDDVQKYVDVMNLLTDDHVSESTYREQFYFELNKGQLFRSINKFEMAYELFDRLDDCDLDSLEQSILNIWLLQTAGDLFVNAQLNDGLALDSISFEIDSTGVNIPASYLANTYYFGAIIESPSSVSYVPCNFQERRKMIFKTEHPLHIFPNPSNGILNIQNTEEETYTYVIIYDAAGQRVYENSKYCENGETWILEFGKHLLTGNYMVQIKNKFNTYTDMIFLN